MALLSLGEASLTVGFETGSLSVSAFVALQDAQSEVSQKHRFR